MIDDPCWETPAAMIDVLEFHPSGPYVTEVNAVGDGPELFLPAVITPHVLAILGEI